MRESSPDEAPEASAQEEAYRPKWWLHGALFAATLVTTYCAGLFMSGGDPWVASTWTDGAKLGSALLYALPLMAILFAHEMGHYLQARRHGVEATPPYFLPGLGPIPGLGMLPLFGTFGAVIRMELRPMRGRSLLEVGAWGPLAGFVLTVPALVAGMALSKIEPLPEETAGLQLGDSLLLLGAEALFFPDIPAGHDVFLHPLAMAGWTGMLLTTLNLLPVSQLDGGHIAYCLFGERFNRVAPWVLAGVVAMGLFVFPGWLLFGALIGVLGPRHPEIVRDGPVRDSSTWLGWASLAIFVLCFAPQPIVTPSIVEMALDALG